MHITVPIYTINFNVLQLSTSIVKIQIYLYKNHLKQFKFGSKFTKICFNIKVRSTSTV